MQNLSRLNFNNKLFIKFDSKIIKYFEKNESHIFSIISAHKMHQSLTENYNQHKKLIKAHHRLGIGWIEIVGGFGGNVSASALFSLRIKKSNVVYLAREFEQDFFLFKDENEFALFQMDKEQAPNRPKPRIFIDFRKIQEERNILKKVVSLNNSQTS